MNDLQMRAAGYAGKKRRKSFALKGLTHEMKLEAAKVAIDSVGGHRRKAAEILGIHVRTLYKWLAQRAS
jgi:DNA-binding NtrC family response regulator